MYEVVYMKADFEPWWMFEEWEDAKISSKTFLCEAEMREYVRTLSLQLENEHEFKEIRKGCFYAFWSTDEKVFCEACDADLQIYHGLIVLKNGLPDISQ